MAAPKSPSAMDNLTQSSPKDQVFSSPFSSSHLSSYLGLSFAVFLGFLPKNSVSYVSSLQSRNRILSLKLFQAEDQLKSLRSRRKEDSKANARVVEIFASHRNAWQNEERRLLKQIEGASEEIARLRARIGEVERAEAEARERAERLERERDEVLDFVSRSKREGEDEDEEEEEEEEEREFGAFAGGSVSEGVNEGFRVSEGLNGPEMDEMARFFGDKNGILASMMESNRWLERPSGWQQDVQIDSLESMYQTRNFITRRESPWKADGDSAISSKLKLLEEELTNLEKVGKGDLSKVSSLMRKQAKRYQSLTSKIDDLCKRMQLSDPCEPTLSSEYRTQQQTEFLVEAVRLQHRATETRQKLSSLQTETTKSYNGNELAGARKLGTRRALETIGNNFKEIQRNLEIWLARISGDVEGILARDGASHVRDGYNISRRYPFVR